MNNLQIIAKQINSNTNLELSRVYIELKMMSLITFSPLFSILSNTKMPILPNLGISKKKKLVNC